MQGRYPSGFWASSWRPCRCHVRIGGSIGRLVYISAGWRWLVLPESTFFATKSERKADSASELFPKAVIFGAVGVRGGYV